MKEFNFFACINTILATLALGCAWIAFATRQGYSDFYTLTILFLNVWFGSKTIYYWLSEDSEDEDDPYDL